MSRPAGRGWWVIPGVVAVGAGVGVAVAAGPTIGSQPAVPARLVVPAAVASPPPTHHPAAPGHPRKTPRPSTTPVPTPPAVRPSWPQPAPTAKVVAPHHAVVTESPDDHSGDTHHDGSGDG